MPFPARFLPAFTGLLLCLLPTLHANPPRPGDVIDLAPFATLRSWTAGHPNHGTDVGRLPDALPIYITTDTGNSNQKVGRGMLADVGLEWTEARDVAGLEVEFESPLRAPDPTLVAIEYWQETWPASDAGGWTLVDDPYRGRWLKAQVSREQQGNRWIYRFLPLTKEENPQAESAAFLQNYALDPSAANANSPASAGVTYRRTLKLRLLLHEPSRAGIRNLRVLGVARWKEGAATVMWKDQAGFEVTPYNGILLGRTHPAPDRAELKFLYTDTTGLQNQHDQTLLTVSRGERRFTFAPADAIAAGRISIPSEQAEIRHGAQTSAPPTGQRIRDRVATHAEQTLDGALAGIPRLAKLRNRDRNLYLPLSPESAWQKFAVTFNGHAFLRKWSTRLAQDSADLADWAPEKLSYLILSGRAGDLREREDATQLERDGGSLPIVHIRWETEGIHYHETAFATYIDGGSTSRTVGVEPVAEDNGLSSTRRGAHEPTVLFLRLVAENRGAQPAPAVLRLRVDPAMKLSVRDGDLYEGDALRVSPQGAALAPAGDDWVLLDRPLAPGESATVTLRVPYRALDAANTKLIRALDFAAEETRVREYWTAVNRAADVLRIPDPRLQQFLAATVSHVLITAYKDTVTGHYHSPAGTFDYAVFSTETLPQARWLDFVGRHQDARRYLDSLLAFQGSMPLPGNYRGSKGVIWGAGLHSHLGYNPANGWIAWRAAEHYRLTQDRAWLQRIADQLVASADWTLRERQATQLLDDQGRRVPEYGLLPPGRLEDNGQWYHWFIVNGYQYRGLAATAEVLAEIDHPAAARLKEAAAAYRADIRRAIERASGLAPVVALRNGVSVPYVPVYPNQRYPYGSQYSTYKQIGWFHEVLMTPLHLVETGVLEDGEPLATAIIDHLEDNQFLSASHGLVPEDFERDWFTRGGFTLQPALVPLTLAYLRRDEVPNALRSYFNTYASLIYPDAKVFSEWFITWGTGGGPFYKTPDECAFAVASRMLLVREDGDRLLLGHGAPREWLQPGKQIGVQEAPTFFGKVTYQIRPAAGRTEAEVTVPDSPRLREVSLRLRASDGRPLRSVTVDGRAWKDFDAASGTIRLPAVAKRTIRVVGEY